MAEVYMQVYELPVRHLTPVVSWLHAHELRYFTRFGLTNCLVQVVGSERELSKFQFMVRELWIVREYSVFPKRHRRLVEEELHSWGIPFKVIPNALAYEVRTEIDERKLEKFHKAIKELIKDERKQRKNKKLRSKNKVLSELDSLLE